MKGHKSNRPLLIGVVSLLAVSAVAYLGIVVRGQVRELEAIAPVKYSISVTPPALKLTQLIKNPAISQDERAANVKLFSEPLTLRATHLLQFNGRVSFIELKKADNPVLADELPQDLKVDVTQLPEGLALKGDQLKVHLLGSPLTATEVTAKIIPKQTIEFTVKELSSDSPTGSIKLSNVSFQYLEAEEKLVFKASDIIVNKTKITDFDVEFIKKQTLNLGGLYGKEEFFLELEFDKLTKDDITLPVISGAAQLPQGLANALLHKQIDALLLASREQVAKSTDPINLKKFDLVKNQRHQKLLFTVMDKLLPWIKFKRAPKTFEFKLSKETAKLRAENEYTRVKYFNDLLARLKQMPLADALNESMYQLATATYEPQIHRTVDAYLKLLPPEATNTLPVKLLSIHAKLYNSHTGNVSNELSSPIWEESALNEAKDLLKLAKTEAPQDKLTIWLTGRLAHNLADKDGLIINYDKLAEVETDPVRKQFWKFYKAFWLNAPDLILQAEELLKLNPSREMATFVRLQHVYDFKEQAEYPRAHELFKTIYQDKILPIGQRTRFISFLINRDQFSEAQTYIDQCYEQESDQAACDEMQLKNTFLIAVQMRKNNRLDEAKKSFEECALLDPTDPDIFHGLANIANQSNKQEAPRYWAIGCALGKEELCKSKSVQDYLAQ